MAATEPIDIVDLGVGDAQAGLELSTEAGWNQNEADWRFFLSKGIVFGVRERSHLVATAALLPYSRGNAWISMVARSEMPNGAAPEPTLSEETPDPLPTSMLRSMPAFSYQPCALA